MVSPRLRRDTRLAEAAKSGDKAAVIALLEKHVDVNAPEIDGTTALQWAIHQDDVATRRAPPPRRRQRQGHEPLRGDSPISEAAVIGNPAMMDKLLKAGADVNSTERRRPDSVDVGSPHGQRRIREAVIGHGANVNAKENYHGQTALMWASAEGLPAMVKELVAARRGVERALQVDHWERDVTAEPRRKYMPLRRLDGPAVRRPPRVSRMR